MIYYPLLAMKKAGIKDVLLTSSPDHAGGFENLLGTGDDGVNLCHRNLREVPNLSSGTAAGIFPLCYPLCLSALCGN